MLGAPGNGSVWEPGSSWPGCLPLGCAWGSPGSGAASLTLHFLISVLLARLPSPVWLLITHLHG